MKPRLSQKWLIATAVFAWLLLLGIWSSNALALAIFFVALAGGLRFVSQVGVRERVLVHLEDDRVAFEFDPDQGRLHIRAGGISLDTAFAVIDWGQVTYIEATDRFSPEVEACLANDYEWTQRENTSVWTRTRFHW